MITMLIQQILRQWRVASLLVVSLLSVGCQQQPPHLESTAEIINGGILRIWRKDVDQEPHTIITAWSPYRGYARLNRINYIQGSVSQVAVTIQSSPVVTELMRFDGTGKTTFQQRQLTDWRESMSDEYIDSMKYAAQQALAMSSALIQRKIKLHQGKYHHGVLTTCEGVETRLFLDESQEHWLAMRSKNNAPIWLAWITTPLGTQLLLVANDDFCAWQPQYDSM